MVGPRLIREDHSAEIAAWKSLPERRLHTAIQEQWHVQQLSKTRTIVALSFVADANNKILMSARWLVKIALDRPLTEPEQDLVSSSKWSEPLNEDAHKLESFPKPQTGLRLPVRLLAFEGLSPGRHEVIVKIQPADRYEPSLVVRAGVFDEALLRGKTLVKSVPPTDSTLRLARNVRIYEQNLDHGAAGPVRRSSIYRLSSLLTKKVPCLCYSDGEQVLRASVDYYDDLFKNSRSLPSSAGGTFVINHVGIIVAEQPPSVDRDVHIPIPAIGLVNDQGVPRGRMRTPI